MRPLVALPFLAVCFFPLTACHYYEEYRVLKSTADIQDEKAELLRAYRQCLTRYQDDPHKAKDFCAPFTHSLREIEGKHQGTR